MMIESFKCSVCGKEHEFHYDVSFGLPKKILKRIIDNQLSYQSDDRWFIIEDDLFFVKAVVDILVKDRDSELSWSVWVKVDRKDFILFIEELGSHRQEKNYIGRGILFSEIPLFNDDLKHEVNYHFKSVKEYPKLKIIDNKSEIGKLITAGVDYNKAKELMTLVYHYT